MRGETTATGLQIRTIKDGTGDPIKAVDGAIIEYEGRLPTARCSTRPRAAAPPMIPGQVIPGFAEALQKMQKGGRYRSASRPRSPMARPAPATARSRPTAT